MAKKVVSGIMLALLLIGMLTLAFNIQPVETELTTIIVPDDYLSIQEAIDAANEGDIIFVSSGTYYEHLTIHDKKNLTIIGEDRSNTIIDGSGSGIVVYVGSPTMNISISHFTIQNGYLYGVLLDNSEGIMLRDNSIRNNQFNFGISGKDISHFIHDIDASNTVDGKPIYYWVNQDNKQVPTDAGYVAIINSTNINVKNLNLTKNRQGLLLAYTTNSTIENLKITGNAEYGLQLLFSSGNIITNNDITNNGEGVILTYSSSNTITGNKLTRAQASGIHVVGQGNVVIKENIIRLNGNGITTEGNTSSGIEIVSNAILSNDEDGIYISSSGADVCSIYNVTISDNYISQNGNGIYMFSNAGTEDAEAYIYRVTISDNRISSNHYGIHIQTHGWYAGYILDSTIFNNTVIFNEDGINIYSGSNWYSWISGVTISSNKVLANQNGISMDAFQEVKPPYTLEPFDTTIVENIVSANNDAGVNIMRHVRANLTRNSVSYNSYGIYIASKDNLARKNDIYRNTLYGMYITDIGTIKAHIDAENNFWGASNGPFHEFLIPDGQGDRVNGNGENLDFYPFLDAPLGYINKPPVAKLGVSLTEVTVNQTVTLDGLKSEDDSRIENYFFDFGDGKNSGWIDIPVIRHKYVSRGLYNVSLIVMDEFGVRSNNTAVEMVTVTLPFLDVSVFLDPIAVLSQGQVLIEVSVTDEEAVGLEEALVQLTSDEGENFNPAFGYTDSKGHFNSTFHAPKVSEPRGVRIMVTVSKEGYENNSESVYLSVLKAPSNGIGFDTSWIWPTATLVVIAIALVMIVKKQKQPKRSVAKRKSSLRTLLLMN